MRKLRFYFSMREILLLFGSVCLIVLSFFLCGGKNPLVLVASLVGACSLLLNAKGNPIGQLLMIGFSVLYGIISYEYAYYGEMITYLGMTAPMALFSLIAWIRHPYQGKKSEVQVAKVRLWQWWLLFALTALITGGGYKLLAALHTTNLFFSTVSVATSFLAVALTFLRSAYYAIGYAANDLVFIVLWIFAMQSDPSYLSVVICFAVFFVNDLYGFFSWRAMCRRQNPDSPPQKDQKETIEPML